MSPVINHQVILDSHANDLPKSTNFIFASSEIGGCDPEKIVVRNHFISIDPAQKGWMSSAVNYASAILGDPMRSLAVGEIIESNIGGYEVGEFVTGWFGWQEYAHVGADSIIRKVDPQVEPIKYAISIFGLNGLTAYIVMESILKAKSTDTVLISTAAGGVGSIAGQLAKKRGCRVVGLTGSTEKARLCIEHYGYDVAINYNSSDWLLQLKEACPDGIDKYFDMAGGWITDEAIQLMNHSSVHAQVGTAAVAAWQPTPLAPRRERLILIKEMTQKGFIIFNHEHMFKEAIEYLASLLSKGELNFKEHIYDGLRSAPAALQEMYEGANIGKSLIRLIDDSGNSATATI